MLLGFIHIFLIAVVISSVEAFMSQLNHESEQVKREERGERRLDAESGEKKKIKKPMLIAFVFLAVRQVRRRIIHLNRFMAQRRLPEKLQTRIRNV